MSHTPNTPANGGQVLTDERIIELRDIAGARYASVGNASYSGACEFARLIEADLRAALAAPAIPTVDRNAVLDAQADAIEGFAEAMVEVGVAGSSRFMALAIGSADRIHSLKSDAPASVPKPAAQVAAQKPDAWLIPHLLIFDGKRTSCPADLIPELEGTMAWGVELFSDGDGVTDKNGVQHKPRPLFAAPATDKTAEGM